MSLDLYWEFEGKAHMSNNGVHLNRAGARTLGTCVSIATQVHFWSKRRAKPTANNQNSPPQHWETTTTIQPQQQHNEGTRGTTTTWRPSPTTKPPVAPGPPPPPASAEAQTNNKLKVFLSNVQTLPPKMDEIIVLTKAENFDIIGLNKTWLDTEEKHILAEVSIEGYKIFSVDKPTPAKRGGGSILYIKNALNPIERKATATRTAQIIQVDINPKHEVHIKIVLIYRNTTITAADDDMFYESLEEILLTQHECIIMGDFNLPNIDWTLGRPTPTPGSKLL